MNRLILIILSVFIFFSCEREVEPSLDSTLNILVIDAWLTNEDLTQHINISRSQPYFDASTPSKVSGAIVTVTDLDDPSIVYTFQEQAERYTWQSTDGNPLGEIGHSYELVVQLDGELYSAVTSLEAVPPIDSFRFRLEEGNAFFDDLIFAEVFATDLEGINDTYWIKTWKNGSFLGKPGEINIAYDAAFSVDADNDGVQFIQPIRDGVNPFEENRDEELLSPYNLPDTLLLRGDTLFYQSDRSFYGLVQGRNVSFEVGPLVNNNVPDDVESVSITDPRFFPIDPETILLRGDSLFVEIHSISNEAYFFLNQVIEETTREAGFGALFATPLSNVSTNLVPGNPDNSVLGFFNISAVSSSGTRLTSDDQIRILE